MTSALLKIRAATSSIILNQIRQIHTLQANLSRSAELINIQYLSIYSCVPFRFYVVSPVSFSPFYLRDLFSFWRVLILCLLSFSSRYHSLPYAKTYFLLQSLCRILILVKQSQINSKLLSKIKTKFFPLKLIYHFIHNTFKSCVNIELLHKFLLDIGIQPRQELIM